MDNLCHSLVGLALAEAGLRRRTRHATATLVIAANLPDVDALLYFAGDATLSLAGRRGWTHGALALVLLPLALAAAVAWWDALRRRRVRRARRSAPTPATWRDLALVAALGVWSHSLLDWLNSYGVRLLMPFSGAWFYGDAVFIIDPWLWLALAVGVLASWRRRRDPRARNPGRPARLALAACAAYAALLVASAAAGRHVVERLVAAAGGRPARRVMAGPVPLTPLRRDVVRDLGDGYEVGTLQWLPRPRYTALGQLASNVAPPLAQAAARTPRGRAFLTWSRFPLFTAGRGQPGRVRIADARYAGSGRTAWAAVEVDVRSAPDGAARARRLPQSP
jgi:inner membrane protein